MTTLRRHFQNRQSSSSNSYVNKADVRNEVEEEEEEEEDPEQAANAWGDLNTDDWGKSQDVIEDKWEDFSTSSASQIKAKTNNNVTTTPNTASWTQDKPPAASQSRNDWDTDAFFNDVLSTASKPKLKMTKR